MTLNDLLTLTYTPTQHEAIRTAVDEAVSSQGIEYFRSDRLVARGQQLFAVFGGTAREIPQFSEMSDEDNRTTFEYLPVIAHGKMVEECPDEGRSGLLFLMRCTRRKGVPFEGEWVAAYIPTGWVHTHELDLSNAQIAENIAWGIESGENVFTQKPAGWA